MLFPLFCEAIVRKRFPASLFFSSTHPLTQLGPFLKSLFLLPSFLFHPRLRCFRQFLPTFTQPPTALIQPTNLPWFKQISKRRFYQSKCPFLSKNMMLCSIFRNTITFARPRRSHANCDVKIYPRYQSIYYY